MMEKGETKHWCEIRTELFLGPSWCRLCFDIWTVLIVSPLPMGNSWE